MKMNCIRNGKDCKWLKTVGHTKYAVQVCKHPNLHYPTALTSLPLCIKSKPCADFEPNKDNASEIGLSAK